MSGGYDVSYDELALLAQLADRQRQHLGAIKSYITSNCDLGDMGPLLFFLVGPYRQAFSVGVRGMEQGETIATAMAERTAKARTSYIDAEREAYDAFNAAAAAAGLPTAPPFSEPGNPPLGPATGGSGPGTAPGLPGAVDPVTGKWVPSSVTTPYGLLKNATSPFGKAPDSLYARGPVDPRDWRNWSDIADYKFWLRRGASEVEAAMRFGIDPTQRDFNAIRHANDLHDRFNQRYDDAFWDTALRADREGRLPAPGDWNPGASGEGRGVDTHYGRTKGVTDTIKGGDAVLNTINNTGKAWNRINGIGDEMQFSGYLDDTAAGPSNNGSISWAR